MSYVITIRIPIKKMEELGIDRDKFKERIESAAKEMIPNAKVEYKKGVG